MRQLRDDALFERRSEHRYQAELRRKRPKLFEALEEFANISGDKDSWEHFRRRWPNFFPEEHYNKVTGPIEGVRRSAIAVVDRTEFERIADRREPSIRPYRLWLNRLWEAAEPAADLYLEIMLGIRPTPKVEELMPEESGASDLCSIQPLYFSLNWREGTISYHGGCDFQHALYLLYRESWRARICELCDSKFIAKRFAQKYCSPDCSDRKQRAAKNKWWNENGQTWRKERKAGKKRKEGNSGTQKTR